jgi:O-methyltransferase
MKILLHAFAKSTFAHLGLQVQRLPGGKPNPLHLWEEDNRFKAIMKRVAGHTLVDKVRCYMLYQFANQVIRLPGDVAEVGVYKGGTARLLAHIFEPADKIVHLFDTFGGMPPVDVNRDLHVQSDFGDTSVKSVQAYLSEFRHVRFYPGLFPETSKPLENNKFCFAHIDVDIYKSVLDCCLFFYPRLERAGVLVFDDYGFVSCPGARMAIDEFFVDKPERPCYLPTGQCVVTKS